MRMFARLLEWVLLPRPNSPISMGHAFLPYRPLPSYANMYVFESHWQSRSLRRRTWR